METPVKQSTRRSRYRKQILCSACGFTFKSRNRLVKHASECEKAQPEAAAGPTSTATASPQSRDSGEPTNLSQGLSSQILSAITSSSTLPKPTMPKLTPIPPLKLTPFPAFTLASTLASMPAPDDKFPQDERASQVPISPGADQSFDAASSRPLGRAPR